MTTLLLNSYSEQKNKTFDVKTLQQMTLQQTTLQQTTNHKRLFVNSTYFFTHS